MLLTNWKHFSIETFRHFGAWKTCVRRRSSWRIRLWYSHIFASSHPSTRRTGRRASKNRMNLFAIQQASLCSSQTYMINALRNLIVHKLHSNSTIKFHRLLINTLKSLRRTRTWLNQSWFTWVFAMYLFCPSRSRLVWHSFDVSIEPFTLGEKRQSKKAARAGKR